LHANSVVVIRFCPEAGRRSLAATMGAAAQFKTVRAPLAFSAGWKGHESTSLLVLSMRLQVRRKLIGE
jgi:hypothetical protein